VKPTEQRFARSHAAGQRNEGLARESHWNKKEMLRQRRQLEVLSGIPERLGRKVKRPDEKGMRDDGKAESRGNTETLVPVDPTRTPDPRHRMAYLGNSAEASGKAMSAPFGK